MLHMSSVFPTTIHGNGGRYFEKVCVKNIFFLCATIVSKNRVTNCELFSTNMCIIYITQLHIENDIKHENAKESSLLKLINIDIHIHR